MSRTTNQFTDLLIADGGHGAVYLLSEDGRGLSLEFLDVHGPDRIVRLTRLR